MTDQQRNYLGQTAYQTYCIGASIMRSDSPLGSLPRWDDLSEDKREEFRAYAVLLQQCEVTHHGNVAGNVLGVTSVRNVSGAIVPCVINAARLASDSDAIVTDTILGNWTFHVSEPYGIHDATAETVGFDEELARMEQAEPLFVIDDTDPAQGRTDG